MKKAISLVLALLMALSCVSALAEVRTKTPAGQIEGGRNVYFVINSAFFKAGSDLIVIGQKGNDYYKRYDQPVTINKVDDDLLVPVDSLSKIFQFSYTYDAATGAIHLEDEYVKADLAIGSKDVTIDGVADTLGAAPAEVDGVLCIPAISVGTKVFTLVTGTSSGYTYLAYEETALPSGSTGSSGIISQLTMAGKIYGVHQPVYWFEEAQMLMPYRLTVPTCYDPETPIPLVVFLHGGSGNDNRDVERVRAIASEESGYLWDFLLDRFGFMGLSVNAYAQGDYGQHVGSDNPATARVSELCELEVMAAIEQVKAKYNIDESRMFIMGNSMGGGGSLRIACHNPGMFAAVSPSPGFNPSEDLTILGDTAIRVVASTEDSGYNRALENYKLWKEKGLNITFRGVCGGPHNIGWAEVMDETFEFFSNVK